MPFKHLRAAVPALITLLCAATVVAQPAGSFYPKGLSAPAPNLIHVQTRNAEAGQDAPLVRIYVGPRQGGEVALAGFPQHDELLRFP
jgi:hypothetical protein